MRMLSGVVLRTQADERLAELAAGGSEAAFEALVQRYRRPLHDYCRRLLLSETRSEDVVQQALIQAWTALRGGAEVTSARAWLYRIVHNQAISALRRPEFDFEALSESLRGSEAPHTELERRLLIRETLAGVAALPEQQREAILRTAIEGQSYEQAAAALGISDHAVRGLIHRARSCLRAGIAAVAPPPLVIWAAGQASRAGSLSDVAAGGGSAGAAAVVLKSATVIATSAVVVGGTVSGAISRALTPASSAPHHARHAHVVAVAAPSRHAQPIVAATAVASPDNARGGPVLSADRQSSPPGAAMGTGTRPAASDKGRRRARTAGPGAPRSDRPSIGSQSRPDRSTGTGQASFGAGAQPSIAGGGGRPQFSGADQTGGGGRQASSRDGGGQAFSGGGGGGQAFSGGGGAPSSGGGGQAFSGGGPAPGFTSGGSSQRNER